MDDTIIKAKVDVTKVDLTCKQVNIAERDAFMFGFDMASKLMHDYYSNEEE